MGRDLSQLHPEFRRRLVAMMDATGTTLTSGYRSSEEQAELYRRYLNGTGNPANPPGSSNHEAIPYGPALGLAADLGGNLTAAHDRCGEFGLHFPIASTEPWHVQPVEVTFAYFTGMPFDEQPAEAPAEPWLMAPRRPAEQLRTSAQGFALIAEFEGFEPDVYGPDRGDVETIGYGETRPDIIERYRYTGITQEQAYALLIERVEADYAPAVRGLGVPLAQSEFDALVSFVYNLGAGILVAGTTMGDALRAAAYYSVADAFGLYVNAGGRRLEGLVRRRRREAELFRSEWGTAPPQSEEDNDLTAYTVTILPGESVFIPVPPAGGTNEMPAVGRVFVTLAAAEDCPGRAVRYTPDGRPGDDPGGDVTVPAGALLWWEMNPGDQGIRFDNGGDVFVTALVQADRAR